MISGSNHSVDIPGKCNNDTIYHVNLIKSYYQYPEFVNLMIEEFGEDIEGDANMSYPLADPTQVDFWKILGDSKLEERASAEEIGKIQ